MKRVKFLVLLYVLVLPVDLSAQDISNFTQFFINPFTFNASYAGIEGRSSFFLAYRKQWATIEGAPSIGNLSYHTPLSGGLNFGLNVTNDTRGILNTSALAFTLGYTVRLDQQKYIRFGISAGGAWNGVDLEEFTDLNDPVLTGLMDKNFSLIGNAGLSVHLKSFHIGAALPNIFSSSFISNESFNLTEVKPFQSIIAHASNRFYFGGNKHVFEPYVIYRMNYGPREEETLPSQLEVAGVVHLNHAVWLGGSYKQDFGISALGGIKNEFFLVGVSYSIANSGVNELNSPTYEIQLSYLFGSKKKDKQVYSFVNSEKEIIKKPPVKTPAQIAAEKKKEEELAKQKAEQERLAQEEKLKAEQEAKARAEEEARIAEAALLAQQIKEEPVQPKPEPVQAQPEPIQPKPEPVQPKPEPVQPKPEPQVQPKTQTPVPTQPVTQQPVVTSQPRSTEVPKPLVLPYIENKFGVHDGGPRFMNRSLLPVLLDEEGELARINAFEKQLANPLEQHNVNPNYNPNASRHEVYKRGDHPKELPSNIYIINGVFSTPDNANRFARRLNTLGFSAGYGHLTAKRLWYVYIDQSNDINYIKKELERYRNFQLFKDAWILTIENQ
jgi:type IX secretion system PorP/SprF family membrane protein